MSINLDNGGDDLAEVAEINVTPFIDMMLVLLTIFMAYRTDRRHRRRPAHLSLSVPIRFGLR